MERAPIRIHPPIGSARVRRIPFAPSDVLAYSSTSDKPWPRDDGGAGGDSLLDRLRTGGTFPTRHLTDRPPDPSGTTDWTVHVVQRHLPEARPAHRNLLQPDLQHRASFEPESHFDSRGAERELQLQSLHGLGLQRLTGVGRRDGPRRAVVYLGRVQGRGRSRTDPIFAGSWTSSEGGLGPHRGGYRGWRPRHLLGNPSDAPAAADGGFPRFVRTAVSISSVYDDSAGGRKRARFPMWHGLSKGVVMPAGRRW